MKLSLPSSHIGWPQWVAIILTALLLSGTARARELDTPDETRYLSQLQVKREENWLQREIRKFRTYRHLDRAYRLMDAGRLQKARAELEKYLAIDPGDLRVQVTYLVFLHRMKDYQEVIRQAGIVLREQPRFVPALLYRGMARQSLDQLDGAMEDLKAVAAISDIEEADRIFALNMVADLAIKQETYADALAALKNLIKVEKNFNHHFRQGIALEGLDRLAGADAAYRLALTLARNSGERLRAYRALGEVTQKRRDWDGARQAFLSALQLDPQNPELMRALGEVAYARKDYPETARWIRQALALGSDPKDREFLANVLYALKDYQAAVEKLTQLLSELDAKEDRYRIYMALGNAYTQWEKSAQASNAFREAAKIKADLPTLTALAQALEREGRLAEAIQYFKETLKRHPTAEAHLKLGILLARVGESANALHHLEVATEGDLPLELKGTAYKQQGFVYHKLGRYAEARQALENALALNPEDPSLYAALGETCLKLDAFGDATNYLKRALVLRETPQRAEILENLGFIYNKLNQYQLAADYFQKAIDAGRDGWRIRQNLGFTLYKLKQWDEALEYFRVSLEHKRTPRSLIYVGRCYKELNKPGMAIYYLRQALLSRAIETGSPTAKDPAPPPERRERGW